MELTYPIGSMYSIFTNIYHKHQPNVGEYIIHGSYGLWLQEFQLQPFETPAPLGSASVPLE